jgi:hypothetical protein
MSVKNNHVSVIKKKSRIRIQIFFFLRQVSSYPTVTFLFNISMTTYGTIQYFAWGTLSAIQCTVKPITTSTYNQQKISLNTASKTLSFMDKLTTNKHVGLFDTVISQRSSDKFYNTFTTREIQIQILLFYIKWSCVSCSGEVPGPAGGGGVHPGGGNGKENPDRGRRCPLRQDGSARTKESRPF